MLIKILQGLINGCDNTLRAVVKRDGSDRAVREVYRQKAKHEKALGNESKRGGKKR